MDLSLGGFGENIKIFQWRARRDSNPLPTASEGAPVKYH